MKNNKTTPPLAVPVEPSPSTPEGKSRKLTMFVKLDKKPATSSILDLNRLNDASETSPNVDGCECGACETGLSNSELVTQNDCERVFIRLQRLRCVEKRIALALSKGAKIEEGIHKAELVPFCGEDGRLSMRLVVR